jgi:hypothetical protein
MISLSLLFVKGGFTKPIRSTRNLHEPMRKFTSLSPDFYEQPFVTVGITGTLLAPRFFTWNLRHSSIE